jgi:FlaG/FlaF family flagellin (archaellin)
MALVKHNNNSISDLTSPGSLAQGKMTLISSQTASGSASIEFTSGIDSTYPIYRFEFINMHPATDGAEFQFNLSTDGGSNYNVTKTTTFFRTYHNESDATTSLEYVTDFDLAQSTSFKTIMRDMGSDNDQAGCGSLKLFNPSSTTFVKHFISDCQHYQLNDFSMRDMTAGYGNTTSAVNAVKFQMSSGNIDSGTIKLYGIKGS